MATVAGIDGYLDIIPNHEGFNHIALFSSASSDTPRFLTSGPWEVAGRIQGIDKKKGLMFVFLSLINQLKTHLCYPFSYFVAAKPSIERHIFSVPIPTISSEELVEPKALTDVTKPSYYSTKFSPQAGFYVLSYEGPSTPWHKIIQTDNPCNPLLLFFIHRLLTVGKFLAFTHELEMNERLGNTTLIYEAATVTTSTIMNDGYGKWRLSPLYE